MIRMQLFLTLGRYRQRRLVAVVGAMALAGFLGVPVAAATTGASSPAAPSASCPWVTSTAPISQRVAQLMASMSLSQEMSMVEGHGTANPYVFYTPAISSLCIPAFGLEDGPAGVADRADRRHSTGRARGAGRHLGSVAGAAVRPGDRRRGGRQGSQRQPRTDRNTPADNVIVDNRALQEIYMPSFNAAVNQANAASVMCAYSMVNSNFSCNSSYLETSVLRDACACASTRRRGSTDMSVRCCG